MLNTVRMPISRRVAAANFIAGWKMVASIKHRPILSRHSATASAPRSILTPSASRTSALPQRLLIARLPCLATLSPAPAAIRAAAVEILVLPDLSPPMPQVSITGGVVLTGMALSRITLASPAISSTVSPLTRSAVTRAAI